ncbi:glucose-6-phosphate dehydrogenase [Solidesulfovibrio sp.]|uniref:glucose-6-phosphate dehydrogenase n=1 Tax=Solidesulfovibrio sp. TaxID=2910990 RepID=UPI002628098A|nr:glucose-6-phosphate dehydrogenase [Solidesulfovibrio sp.]
MADAQSPALAEVVLGRPKNPTPDAACRFDAVEAPVTFVIFGVTGDLAGRMLMPALAALYAGGNMPERFAIVGASRTALDDETFRQRMRDALDAHGGVAPEVWEALAPRLTYQRVHYDEPASFTELAGFLDALAERENLGGDRVFYLAVPPTAYEAIAVNLAMAGLADEGKGHARLVIEKPFGRDLPTAQVLEQALHTRFSEHQIFRIDHYLAKETVQNILMLRFANAIFEPVWNRRYVDYVSILAAEAIGVEHRASYYDHFGVLRDMFQNHMMQLLSLCAIEPPSLFEAELVRDEKTKVFRALRPFTRTDLAENLVLGQYASGVYDGARAPAYLDEEGVPGDSLTPTFAAMKVYLDNWRWQGVPFYMISGKRLPEKRTEIAVQFKPVPFSMFRDIFGDHIQANRLMLRIQPDEQVSLTFQAKAPGPMCLRSVTMNFNYYQGYEGPQLPAYAKVLLDCMLGDQTLFWRQDGVELCWRFLAPMLGDPDPRRLFLYKAGSWGPQEAGKLLKAHGLTP